MSDDFELWIITPISGITIVTIIGCIIGAIYVGVEGISEFLRNYLPIIVRVILIIIPIIAGVSTIITSINFKYPLFIISGSVIASQSIFFVFKGYQTVLAANDSLIWFIIAFMFWVIYGLINIAITFLGLGIPCLFSFAGPKKITIKNSLIKKKKQVLSQKIYYYYLALKLESVQ